MLPPGGGGTGAEGAGRNLEGSGLKFYGRQKKRGQAGF